MPHVVTVYVAIKCSVANRNFETNSINERASTFIIIMLAVKALVKPFIVF